MGGIRNARRMAFVLAGVLLLPACGTEDASQVDVVPSSPTASSTTTPSLTAPQNSHPPTSSTGLPSHPGTSSSPDGSGATDGGTPTGSRPGGGSSTKTSGPTRTSGPTKTTNTQVVVPVISFSDKTIEFRRHGMALAATVTPKGPIEYTVVRGGPGSSADGQCFIVDGRLRLVNPHVPGDSQPPALSAVCLIEANVRASGGHPAAVPKRALIKVWYPAFDVHVDPVPDVVWSQTNQVTVHVRELSGAAYTVYVNGKGTDNCSGGTDPVSGYSAPDTHRYNITVTLAKPDSPAGYTCSMFARAGPVNIAGSSEDVPFTLTVLP